MTALALVLLLGSASPAERFHQAGELVRSGDSVKGIATYRELAASGTESASLYWNWAQAAAARGARGEALWALLRARELDPGDAAIRREIERHREAANLDAAEIAPQPAAAVARTARRFHLDLLGAGLLTLSLGLHAAGRLLATRRGTWAAAWTTLVLGLLLAAFPLAGSFAQPAAVVVHRAAPLIDAASPTAEAIGSLREGEVVPILERSGEYLRIQDSSGARGWARAEDVWGLEGLPPRLEAP